MILLPTPNIFMVFMPDEAFLYSNLPIMYSIVHGGVGSRYETVFAGKGIRLVSMEMSHVNLRAY